MSRAPLALAGDLSLSITGDSLDNGDSCRAATSGESLVLWTRGEDLVQREGKIL